MAKHSPQILASEENPSLPLCHLPFGMPLLPVPYGLPWLSHCLQMVCWGWGQDELPHPQLTNTPPPIPIDFLPKLFGFWHNSNKEEGDRGWSSVVSNSVLCWRSSESSYKMYCGFDSLLRQVEKTFFSSSQSILVQTFQFLAFLTFKCIACTGLGSLHAIQSPCPPLEKRGPNN